jgi:hypothetical protein
MNGMEWNGIPSPDTSRQRQQCSRRGHLYIHMQLLEYMLNQIQIKPETRTLLA